MLKGTEKQVAWAEDIIREARETIKRNIEIEKAEEEKNNVPGFFAIEIACFEECGKSLEQMLSGINEASKIIDMRYRLSSGAILKMVNDEVCRRRNRK